jgi:hypothetical protein
VPPVHAANLASSPTGVLHLSLRHRIFGSSLSDAMHTRGASKPADSYRFCVNSLVRLCRALAIPTQICRALLEVCGGVLSISAKIDNTAFVHSNHAAVQEL